MSTYLHARVVEVKQTDGVRHRNHSSPWKCVALALHKLLDQNNQTEQDTRRVSILLCAITSFIQRTRESLEDPTPSHEDLRMLVWHAADALEPPLRTLLKPGDLQGFASDLSKTLVDALKFALRVSPPTVNPRNAPPEDARGILNDTGTSTTLGTFQNIARSYRGLYGEDVGQDLTELCKRLRGVSLKSTNIVESSSGTFVYFSSESV